MRRVFLTIANGHIKTDILRQCNSQIGIEEGIFGKLFVSSDYSGTTTLTRITLKFTIICQNENWYIKLFSISNFHDFLTNRHQ